MLLFRNPVMRNSAADAEPAPLEGAINNAYGSTILAPEARPATLTPQLPLRQYVDHDVAMHGADAIMQREMTDISECLTRRGIENRLVQLEHAPWRIEIARPSPLLPIYIDYSTADVRWRPYNVFIEGTQRRTHSLDEAVTAIEVALGTVRVDEDRIAGDRALLALAEDLKTSAAFWVVECAPDGRAIAISIYASAIHYEGLRNDHSILRIAYDRLHAPDGPYRTIGPWTGGRRGLARADALWLINAQFGQGSC